jgi:UDP-glucose 4-epimerase
MKKIGITGCKGFIGSHFVDYCRQHSLPYVCFLGDLLNSEDVQHFFSENAIDQLIHLVGTFDPPFQNQIEKNVMTLQTIVNIGINHGLTKIIYASSGAIYGEPLHETSKESDNLRPNTLYGLSKLFAESCIQYYSNNYGIHYVILRFPNVYGLDAQKGVISRFLYDIKTKGEITIAGDGLQSRNFLHVDDACRALAKAIDYNTSDIFNISNSQKLTINEVVDMLKKKYVFTIDHAPKDNNLKNLLLDGSKAKRLLGFEANYKNLFL